MLSLTGGARIGWVNATWPLAKLTASAEELSVSGALLGAYVFSARDVTALEPYRRFTFFARGVQIVHTNATYPEKIIFWGFGSPEKLISEIHELGFRPGAPSAAIPERHGIPIRWSYIVALVLVWNALFLLDGYTPWQVSKPPGVFTLLALLVVFASAMAVAHSTEVQAVVFKPGRFVTEVGATLRLVQFVSLVMLVGFAAQYLSG